MINSLNHKTVNAINSSNLYSCGRSALSAILTKISVERKSRRILLPDYLCSSITYSVINAGWVPDFYHVNDDLDIENYDCIKNSECILIINYFGLIDVDRIISRIKSINMSILVILDNVQSLFDMENHYGEDYAFTSFRKWLPLPDGAYIEPSIKCDFNKSNNFAGYKLAGNYLKGMSGYLQDDIYLGLINKGEEILDKEYNCQCSNYTKENINYIDLDKIAEKRIYNASILHKELQNLGVKHLYKESAVPMFIPLFIDNRDEIKKEFYKHQVFTPIHWPYESQELNGVYNYFYKNELSLICDQRYCESQMLEQIQVLKKCL